jgi:hypothetical protein
MAHESHTKWTWKMLSIELKNLLTPVQVSGLQVQNRAQNSCINSQCGPSKSILV